jgi:hypothetical protein
VKVKKQIKGDIINAVRLETAGHVRKKEEKSWNKTLKMLKDKKYIQ